MSVAAHSTLVATIADDAVGVLDGVDDGEPPLTDVLLDACIAPTASRLPAR